MQCSFRLPALFFHFFLNGDDKSGSLIQFCFFVFQVLCLMAREGRWDIDLLDVLSAVVFETQGASRIAALRLFSIICRFV